MSLNKILRLTSIACNILGKCFSKKATSSIHEKQQQIFSKNNKLKKRCTNLKQIKESQSEQIFYKHAYEQQF